MPAVQLNTRIDAQVKEQGDAVLLRSGYTPSQAVRSLWSFVIEHQDVPSFMKNADEVKGGVDGSRALAMEGFGLAMRLAEEKGLPFSVESAPDFETLEDEMYDEMFDEYEVSHV